MRFKRPSPPVAAIRCPSCRHIFEVESALLSEEPIIAEVVEEEPLAVVVIEEPRSPRSVPQPARNSSTDSRPASSTQPQPTATEPVPALMRPILPHKKKSPDTARKSSNARLTSKRSVWIASAAAGFVLCVVAAFSLTKFLSDGSQPSQLDKLGSRYEETLESVRQSMASHLSAPDQQNVNDQVLQLRSLLLDCVNTASQPESQTSELREKLNRLGDVQVEVRRLSSQIAASFDRKSLVDQVPSMIELITKQLNYGIRQSRPSREAGNQFCSAAFTEFRRIDQSLGKALLAGQINIEQIGQYMDELDQLIADYSQSAESRAELGFENKQIMECGAAWRGWSLRQLQLTGQAEASQAVSKELDALKSRFDQALNAVAVYMPNIAALDRINKRINDPLAATKSDFAKASQSSDKASGTNTSLSGSAASIPSLDVNSSIPSGDTSSPSTNSQASNSINPFEVQQPTSNAALGSQSIPQGAGSSTTTNPSSSNSQSSNSSSIDSSLSVPTSLSNSGVAYFPPARFQGPSTLTIKITTSKSQNEILQIGTSIAAKIGSVLDLQVQGNQATLSFNNFSGKVHQAVKHVSFGKVEIADSQSRTLFVRDSQ